MKTGALDILLAGDVPQTVCQHLLDAGHTVKHDPSLVYDGILGPRCIRLDGELWAPKYLNMAVKALRTEKRERTPRKTKVKKWPQP